MFSSKNFRETHNYLLIPKEYLLHTIKDLLTRVKLLH